MERMNMWLACVIFCFYVALGLTACQTSSISEGTIEVNTTDSTATRRLSPERVDIRGFIIQDRYYQGQVTLEIEGTPSQHTRYNRAAVLVLPTTQVIGKGGKSAGLPDLRQGQYVSVLLRSGGRGNQEGVGIARKIWLEEID